MGLRDFVPSPHKGSGGLFRRNRPLRSLRSLRDTGTPPLRGYSPPLTGLRPSSGGEYSLQGGVFGADEGGIHPQKGVSFPPMAGSYAPSGLRSPILEGIHPLLGVYSRYQGGFAPSTPHTSVNIFPAYYSAPSPPRSLRSRGSEGAE